MQKASLEILTADHARAEAEAIRTAFRRKRNKLVDGLRALGVRIEREPEGTFYVWGNVSNLPPGLNTGDELFRRALEKKVIVVPGHFFDVDPGQRRVGRASRFNQHVRFSFGPSEETIDTAIARLTEVVRGS
jgi:aspartate/methionine/tyrosine aminotransferase